MKTPKWLATTLSFILIGLLFLAYLLTHAPGKPMSNVTLPAPDVSNTPSTEVSPNEPGITYANPITSTPSFTHSFGIGNKKLQVAYADTPAEQEQGLSNTVPLKDGEGMLFSFSAPSTTGFWMKDMNYPLDIIWIGSSRKVVDISPNLAPDTYPTIFAPKEPFLYVLEVPAGFAEKNNITVGTLAFTANLD